MNGLNYSGTPRPNPLSTMDLWYQIRRVADLEPIQIDGWVFRLHYWVTSTGILAASAVAFAKQYFGDPIECIFVSRISVSKCQFF